jgi:hypothetical protein
MAKVGDCRADVGLGSRQFLTRGEGFFGFSIFLMLSDELARVLPAQIANWDAGLRLPDGIDDLLLRKR